MRNSRLPSLPSVLSSSHFVLAQFNLAASIDETLELNKISKNVDIIIARSLSAQFIANDWQLLTAKNNCIETLQLWNPVSFIFDWIDAHAGLKRQYRRVEEYSISFLRMLFVPWSRFNGHFLLVHAIIIEDPFSVGYWWFARSESFVHTCSRIHLPSYTRNHVNRCGKSHAEFVIALIYTHGVR